jgi:hypothetical protein
MPKTIHHRYIVGRISKVLDKQPQHIALKMHPIKGHENLLFKFLICMHCHF